MIANAAKGANEKKANERKKTIRQPYTAVIKTGKLETDEGTNPVSNFIKPLHEWTGVSQQTGQETAR